MRWWLFVVVLSVAGLCRAQEDPPGPASMPGSTDGAAVAVDQTAPAVPPDAAWASTMVWVILGAFFVAAAVIGPVVVRNLPKQAPAETLHDETAGAHQQHGSTH